MSEAGDAITARAVRGRRDRLVLVFLWMQVPALALTGLVVGEQVYEIALSSLVVASLALLGMAFRNRRLAETTVGIGLVVAAGIFVAYAGGALYAHFAFFVAVAAISLYHDWLPLGIGVLAVFGWHATVTPGEALTHTGAVLALALLLTAGWRTSDSDARDADASDARFRVGFDTAPIGMSVLKPSGELLEVNLVMADILGYDQGSLIGTNISALVHPDDHDHLGRAWEEMGNGAGQAATEWMRCLTGRGRPIWGRVSLCLVPHGNGQPAMVILQLEDVDHIYEEQRRLKTLLEGKDEFVAALGDEIRRPLGYLIDLTALADHQHVDTSKTLPRIEAHAREIASILDDLVVSARAGTTPVSVMAHQLDAEQLCRQVMRVTAGAEKVDMEFRARHIWADPSLTKQIVTGLVHNAIRYGGPTVSLRTIPSGPDTVIQVVDDGPEIPIGDRERVFSGDLRNGRPVTSPAAVGLSLTVGRYLARQMDGDISYRRTPDGENVFELRLPTEQISAPPLLADRSHDIGIPA